MPRVGVGSNMGWAGWLCGFSQPGQERPLSHHPRKWPRVTACDHFVCMYVRTCMWQSEVSFPDALQLSFFFLDTSLSRPLELTHWEDGQPMSTRDLLFSTSALGLQVQILEVQTRSPACVAVALPAELSPQPFPLTFLTPDVMAMTVLLTGWEV